MLTIIAKGGHNVAILVSAVVGFYGVLLLTVGQPWTHVFEGRGDRTIQFQPSPTAAVIVLAVVILIGGLALRKLWLGWIGLAVLSAFSILFVFGIGGILLPADVILLASLAIVQLEARRGKLEMAKRH